MADDTGGFSTAEIALAVDERWPDLFGRTDPFTAADIDGATKNAVLGFLKKAAMHGLVESTKVTVRGGTALQWTCTERAHELHRALSTLHAVEAPSPRPSLAVVALLEEEFLVDPTTAEGDLFLALLREVAGRQEPTRVYRLTPVDDASR